MMDAGGHSELQALLGAYALGAVEGAERVAIEAHLEGCAPCRRELAQLREAAGTLPTAPRPPDELWRRIVDEVRVFEQEEREHGGEGEFQPD